MIAEIAVLSNALWIIDLLYENGDVSPRSGGG